MSIRIGIYDFFAYTIPGILYLIAGMYLCQTLKFVILDKQWLRSISTVEALLFALIGYLLGLLFDPIAKRWYRLFKPKDLSKVVLDEFKAKHPNFVVKFGEGDWYIVLSYLRKVSEETAYNIERFNATNIMLRNVSFLSFVLAIIQTGRLIVCFSWLEFVLCVVFAVFALIAGKESVKYAKWFYSSQYASIAAHSITAQDLVELHSVTHEQST